MKDGYTDNGMHLTELGYAATVDVLRKALDWPVTKFEVVVGEKLSATGGQVKAKDGQHSFELVANSLPGVGSWDSKLVITCRNPFPGENKLLIDGNKITSMSADWLKLGASVQWGPGSTQARQLRQAIVDKNQLYFYRWRPQNETYLGFRKHEQGKNGKEVAEFDPLIAAKEKEIANYRKPVVHTYEIVEGDNKR